MLAPVIRRQGNSIQNMLVEKQDLNSEKLRRNFEEISSVTKMETSPQTGFLQDY